MKKYLFAASVLALSLGFTACSDDDDNNGTETGMPEGTSDSRVVIEDNNIDVTTDNIDAWGKYSSAVAQLLEYDAAELEYSWVTSYKEGDPFATTFKTPGEGKTYTSYNACVEQIIDGCIDIAGEVGSAKIGEPRDLWEKGKYTEAVYAVESWYSFHSIDDYSNNILSIANAFFGTRDLSQASASLASYLSENNPTLYATTKSAIENAYNAIKNGMVAPFRSHIGNASVLTAMQACARLGDVLDNQVKPYFNNVDDDEALKAIVVNYVEKVVVPTYTDLREATATLKTAVYALQLNPSTLNFKIAAEAWMAARQPWESSEAFLFGPVDELGLDPNMDSWPLDVDAIKKVLASGDFSQMEWADGEDDEDIEAAQNVRGFHTLEFLLFKDGEPRKY